MHSMPKSQEESPHKRISVQIPKALADMFDERCERMGFSKGKLFKIWCINFIETTDVAVGVERIGEYPPHTP